MIDQLISICQMYPNILFV